MKISMLVLILALNLIFSATIYCKFKPCAELDDMFFDELSTYTTNNNTLFEDLNSPIYTESESFPAICDKTKTGYNKDVAPYHPMDLGMGIAIYEVTDVDHKAYTISVSMSLWIYWKDNRTEPTLRRLINQFQSTAATQNVSSVNYTTISLNSATKNDLWKPNIKIRRLQSVKRNVRSLSVNNKAEEIIYDINDEVFIQNSELLVVMSCEMDFTNYPYDSNICPFNVYEEGNGPGQSSTILIENYFYVKQDEPYNVKKHGIPFQISVSKAEMIWNEDFKFFLSGINIKINRRSNQIMWSYFIPAAIYVMISWISFTIPVHIVPARMGLLITLYLIMMNTYGGVQHTGPQDRGIGVIEVWGFGCTFCIFVAMIEYAIILYKMKSEHDNGCRLQYKNKKMMKGKCCKNHQFSSWDNRCLVSIPIFFFLFNIIFWNCVSYLQN